MSGKILWIDDVVDLLKPHIVFLEKKGYEVTPVNNVNEALELIEQENFALTLLDENGDTILVAVRHAYCTFGKCPECLVQRRRSTVAASFKVVERFFQSRRERGKKTCEHGLNERVF